MATSFPKESKRQIIEKHRRGDKDSGSCEVQVAIITERIRYLTDHLAAHSKDHASRRGLLMLVGKRSRLLRFLQRDDTPRYQDLIKSLGLRK